MPPVEDMACQSRSNDQEHTIRRRKTVHCPALNENLRPRVSLSIVNELFTMPKALINEAILGIFRQKGGILAQINHDPRSDYPTIFLSSAVHGALCAKRDDLPE
jgi:hypothetical protein